MAIITMTAGLLITRQTWGQKRFDMRFQNGDSGAGQSRILAPSRWTTSLSSQAELNQANSAIWRSLILDLQGQINQLAVYDIINAAPQGTMRGTLTLNAQATAGDTGLSITGGAGQASTTLKRGDWVGIGSGSTRQLLSISADAVANASGVIAVSVAQPVRWTQTNGSAVTWDKPTALFRTTSDNNSWTAQSINQGGYNLDLIESWE